MPRRSVLVGLLALATGIPSAAFGSDCTGTSTGLVPLIDLGAGTYQGFSGGLYPGGANVRPAVHDAAGLAIAQSIVPLDTLGQPDHNGRVVLISIGMSNCTQEFGTFVPKSNADPLRRPRTIAIDCAKGGQATQDIRLPGAAYWDTVATRLRGRGSSPLQAQVVWLKEARRGPTEGFPAATDSLLADLGTIVRIVKQKLPNVRLLYLTSRIYAGYASTLLNPEPYAYESGFAVKWLIEAQITGADSLNFDPTAGVVEAPWLSWGPYLWADGLSARSDGLVWTCDDFQDDGTHPSVSGRNQVADSLLAFFRTESTAIPWYRIPGTAAAPRSDARIDLAIAPNPFVRSVTLRFSAAPGTRWTVRVLDLMGRRVRTLGAGTATGAPIQLAWDGADDRGRRLGLGVFWIALERAGHVDAQRVLRLE